MPFSPLSCFQWAVHIDFSWTFLQARLLLITHLFYIKKVCRETERGVCVREREMWFSEAVVKGLCMLGVECRQLLRPGHWNKYTNTHVRAHTYTQRHIHVPGHTQTHTHTDWHRDTYTQRHRHTQSPSLDCQFTGADCERTKFWVYLSAMKTPEQHFKMDWLAVCFKLGLSYNMHHL